MKAYSPDKGIPRKPMRTQLREYPTKNFVRYEDS